MTATLTEPHTVKLTTREQQVAVLLAYGYTNNQVARELAISTRTVEMHRHNAMERLGVHTRAEISRWALDLHLLH